VHQAHATQHIGRLSELDIVVPDDLDSIALRVPKVKEGTIKWANASCLECLAGRFLVVNDETKVATIVCGLPATLLKRDKLIAKVDEGHGVTFAAQFKPEETTVERQRLIDIPHLQCDVVEANDARS
jgi:hypothetical protein